MGYHRQSARIAIRLMMPLMITMILLIASVNTMGATHTKKVRGYVWDSAGAPINAANITINIKDGPTLLRTKASVTDVNGYFSITYQADDWNIGNTIEVIANYNSNQETNSSIADDSDIQWVNVTFPFEIPVFGSWLGFVVGGVFLGAIAIFFIAMRKKHREDK